MSAPVVRLSLGTAQWGTAYGLTNVRGELSDGDVAGIVQTALDFGITSVDTHRTTNPQQGYGRAQSRLRPWARDFSVTTKVFGGPSADVPVIEQLSASLSDLGLESVHACLVHDWYELSDEAARATVKALVDARARGLVTLVGVSAYDQTDLRRAVDTFGSDLGAVQVPVSVVDQRLVGSSIVSELTDMNAEIQVRSVFLQGLLLSPNAAVGLAQHPSIVRFHRYCATVNLDPLMMISSFINSLPWVDVAVVGVTSAAELTEISGTWASEPTILDWSAFASTDTDLLDPRRWVRR